MAKGISAVCKDVFWSLLTLPAINHIFESRDVNVWSEGEAYNVMQLHPYNVLSDRTVVVAAGQYVPPMFIFPRKNMNQRLMDNAPSGCIGTCIPTGWINEEKFTMWFDHFIKTVQPQAHQSPTLLIFDGHASHIRNIDIIDKAQETNVTLLCLPSHCTHKLQPLDVSFFKSMNWQYDEEIRNWMRDHDGRHVTEFDVAGILPKLPLLKMLFPAFRNAEFTLSVKTCLQMKTVFTEF